MIAAADSVGGRGRIAVRLPRQSLRVVLSQLQLELQSLSASRAIKFHCFPSSSLVVSFSLEKDGLCFLYQYRLGSSDNND